MDFTAEYKDFFENLGDAATYTYKFFDLFKVNLGNGEDEKGEKLVKGSASSALGRQGLHWGKDTSDDTLTVEQLREVKTYLKAQKQWVRKEQKNVKRKECRRRIWFLVQKLIELGAFTRGERREIILWMDNFNYIVGCLLDEED